MKNDMNSVESNSRGFQGGDGVRICSVPAGNSFKVDSLTRCAMSEEFASSADLLDFEIPLIRVGLFGGFEASRDAIPLDYSSLNRYMVQTLLSILVLGGDRDTNCAHVAKSLWPESTEEKGRRSLYSLWSLLRQALMLPNKQCPYLERRTTSCKLVGRYFVTDVHLVSSLCNALQFDCQSPDAIMEASRRLRNVYRGDLLPGEERNSMILRHRWEWRSRVVEAFAKAARTMFSQEYFHEAIWLARSAISVDPTREDVCLVLMRCYVAVGAKAAAIQAFNELRHYLMVDLAISPSPSILEYFNSLIIDEDDCADTELFD